MSCVVETIELLVQVNVTSCTLLEVNFVLRSLLEVSVALNMHRPCCITGERTAMVVFWIHAKIEVSSFIFLYLGLNIPCAVRVIPGILGVSTCTNVVLTTGLIIGTIFLLNVRLMGSEAVATRTISFGVEEFVLPKPLLGDGGAALNLATPLFSIAS